MGLEQTAETGTFPEVVFFVTNVTSVVPDGPGPTSQICVSRLSPGLTGAVNRTPNSFKARGSLFATTFRRARAAKPYVERPCNITPPKPAACPIFGSDI